MDRVCDRDHAFVKEVGKKIRAARLGAGLSQRKLAAIVRMKPAALTNIEGGRVSMNLSTLKQIADALVMDVKGFL